MLTTTFYFHYEDERDARKALCSIPNLPIKASTLRQVHGCNPNHKLEIVEVHFQVPGNHLPHPADFPKAKVLNIIANATNAVAVTSGPHQLWPNLKIAQ